MRRFFFWINHGLSNGLFDVVMPWIREKLVWIPLYIFIIGLSIKKFGWKAVWVVLFALLSVAAADLLSAKVLKPWIMRPRPCHALVQDVILRVDSCGGAYGFVSSHATNHFAMAMFFIFVFRRPSNKQFVYLFFLIWAGLISFAQVYVGVHYPFDVLLGALLGLLIGYGAGWGYLYTLCHRSGKLI
jgi:membrane-associated phospholipid phosphatase